MRNLINLLIVLFVSSATLISAEKKITAEYTDDMGVHYVKYEGEQFWNTTDVGVEGNPMLTGNMKPGVNMTVDEGQIVIELYDNSGMFTNTGLDKDAQLNIATDEEMNSFEVFPNPSENNLNVEFYLDDPGVVEIEMFEVTGTKISVLVNKNFEPGPHSIKLDSKKYPNREYYLSFRVHDKKVTKLVIFQ